MGKPGIRPGSWVGVGFALFIPTLLFAHGTGQGGGAQAPPPPPPPTLPQPAIQIHRLDGVTVRTTVRRARKLAELTMAIPADNPQTDEKIALGRRLFFDPQLSVDRSVSCATCHDPERAFADTKPLAVGVFGRVGKRHSPSLVNRGFGRIQFWDGRTTTLETQVLQPIEDPNEMAATLDEVVARLAADEAYRGAFQTTFDRPVVAEDLGRALASYLRTVRSGESPFDRFLDNEPGALSPEAQQGLRIFRSKGRCTFCHMEPTFSDEQFHNTGVAWRLDESGGTLLDEGRFAISKTPRDRGAFKTPTLREVARTAPYMHDGSLQTLEDVVEFYDKGGRPNPSLTRLIRPIGLTPEEKKALVAFLESLSGVVTGK